MMDERAEAQAAAARAESEVGPVKTDAHGALK
jgi:hypothetical protein